MPRKPRNPGSGKPPHNGPAQGRGWGGAAKGKGRKSAGKLIPGAAVKAGCAVPGVQDFVPTYKGLADKERIEALKELQWGIAFTSKFEGNRLTASQHLLDRLDGKAVQRQIVGELGDISKLTTEELDERIAELTAKISHNE
jgi:hypothetical protein